MSALCRDLFAALVLAGVFSSVQAATPADPNANQRARNLLNYLAGLPGQTSNKVISGQIHIGYINAVQTQTGKAPGLLGEQLCGLNNWDDWAGATTYRQQLLDHWNAGGIVSVYLMTGNPVSMRGMRDFTRNGVNQLTLADIQSVYAEGTTPNANYKSQLDKAAIHLQWLSDHGVPILLRPLMEMNLGSFGGGFWHSNWRDGSQNGQPYKTLWQYTFNYLTNTKGLHNLLWVYASANWLGTAAGEGDWEYTGYYPGDGYVDITGLDMYSDAWKTGAITASDCHGFGLLRPLGKPAAFAECGPGGEIPQGSDYRKLVTAIKTFAPDCIYWMSWSVQWSMDTNYGATFVNETLNDPWVCNRDEIPDLQTVITPPGDITSGETNVLAGNDGGYGNLLIGQQATLPQSAILKKLSFNVITAAGNLRLGIYDSTGPGGGPGNLLAATAELTPAVGWNTADVLTPVVLPPGTYWLAHLPSSSSLRYPVQSGNGSIRYHSYPYAPMPATFPTPLSSGTLHWSLYATLTPIPTLGIQLSGTNVVLSWSSFYTGAVLKSSPSVSAPTWTTVGTTPLFNGDLKTVTLPASSDAVFYRLFQ